MRTSALTVAAAMVIAVVVVAPRAASEDAAGALAEMPVREVTVFKDGHAYVVHQGRMPTDPAGNVLLDYLPAPVLGTFWPYSADEQARLRAVTAGRHRVRVEETALSLRELIEANAGAVALITETGAGAPSEPYLATILSPPVRSGEELRAASPPDSEEHLPVRGELALLKTAEGTRAVPLSRIEAVTFKKEPRPKLAREEFRNRLTLELDWEGDQPAERADVGLLYVQRGIRWIPNYKITLDGKGKATVELQATLLNELTDLEDVTCNLVIGVPAFAFKDTVDPMSLEATMARLSRYFQEDQVGAQMLSNAIMTQTARMGEVRGRSQAAERPALDLGPEIEGSGKAEDLFVFTVKHVSLRKGERMVLPVVEVTLPYEDVFVLDLPFVPPPEVLRQFNSQQQAEIARMLAAPKVIRNIRLTNDSDYPLTTAPALIFHGRRLLAQGMMTYTSAGAAADLPVTAAVDIRLEKSDRETRRVPDAERWGGDSYARIDLEGTIRLTNLRDTPAALEVVRSVLGNVTEADHDGEVEMVNVLEDATYGRPPGYPQWWGWYGWPHWWRHFNGVGRVTWKLDLEPDQTVELGYAWHYFWR